MMAGPAPFVADLAHGAAMAFAAVSPVSVGLLAVMLMGL